MSYIEMLNSCKTYEMGDSKIYANKDVNFAIEKGELAIILGASGAGKSTVLNILGGMDSNDQGKVVIDGKQRVAIARAIAKNPKILLCDEPTGALDYQTGKQVLQILQDMCTQKGATVVMVTHNTAIAPIANRVIHMHDAQVKNIEVNSNPQSIAEIEW